MITLRIFLLFLLVEHTCLGSTVSRNFFDAHQMFDTTSHSTYLAIKRALYIAGFAKRRNYVGIQPLDRSWNDASLLWLPISKKSPDNPKIVRDKTTMIEVNCTTCYLTGLVKAELEIDTDFNFTQAVHETTDAISNSFSNLTEVFESYMYNYTTNVISSLHNISSWKALEMPVIPFTFDIEPPEMPAVNVNLQFDGLEIYLELNVWMVARATYEINLYTSQTPIGIRIGSSLQLGVVVAVDLILSVDSVLDINTGFHIQLSDGCAFKIALFADRISRMVFNGGQFEFFPVTVESAGAVLSAVLRIGVHIGIELSSKHPLWGVKIPNFPRLSSGIEFSVVAHLAEFITNITASPKDEKCKLGVVQEYNFALGAGAGASIALELPPYFVPQTWGPVIATSTAVYTTKLKEVCAMPHKSVSVQNSAISAIQRREDLVTSTLFRSITQTGVRCMDPSIVNCPASKQTTTKMTLIKYHTTAVPSGEIVTFPEQVFSSVQATRPFGTRVRTIRAMSGSPTKYTEPLPPTPTDGKNDERPDDKLPGEESNGIKRDMVIGLSAGLGAPVILAAAVVTVLLLRRRGKRAADIDTAIMSETNNNNNNNNHDVYEGGGTKAI